MKATGSKLSRFVETTDSMGYKLTVDYDTEIGRYLVTVTSPSGKEKSDTFVQSFTPTFGMDVHDMNHALFMAEWLAYSLEDTDTASLGE